jgi:hypothetical protein
MSHQGKQGGVGNRTAEVTGSIPVGSIIKFGLWTPCAEVLGDWIGNVRHSVGC